MRIEITYAEGSKQWKQTVHDTLLRLDGLRLPYEIDLVESGRHAVPSIPSQQPRPSVVALHR